MFDGGPAVKACVATHNKKDGLCCLQFSSRDTQDKAHTRLHRIVGCSA